MINAILMELRSKQVASEIDTVMQDVIIKLDTTEISQRSHLSDAFLYNPGD